MNNDASEVNHRLIITFKILIPCHNTRFWGQLKNELVYHKTNETRQQAIADVTKYIEIFYNRQRIQEG